MMDIQIFIESLARLRLGRIVVSRAETGLRFNEHLEREDSALSFVRPGARSVSKASCRSGATRLKNPNSLVLGSPLQPPEQGPSLTSSAKMPVRGETHV